MDGQLASKVRPVLVAETTSREKDDAGKEGGTKTQKPSCLLIEGFSDSGSPASLYVVQTRKSFSSTRPERAENY